ncbi:alpha-L-glutamate ligase-like protein [Marinibactrum halimedae]|uniref:Alpha-L-glutamate ligase-like protein n=1 Tax=Marinibactrum halimedae TaxID=1444977 RepID=A0AA37WM77_9GAMM|nr:alpha-L-glutamate ligase-like protein [Marinibactrum halimedae]MCD9458338.1 alpha-L-glutamate ligase-like protein [Marinibactrum halimedae]GLS27034.1 alpha-L-glutamate ligase-like protein [Marinibactrum halimedae]
MIRKYWERYKKLRNSGVLGINCRNVHYIGTYNPRCHFPNVDDKLKTKLLAAEYNVNSPELIAVIDTQHDIQSLSEKVANFPGFVIKPSKGSGGKGIMLLEQHTPGHFQKLNGQAMEESTVRLHVSNILSGLYSLGGKPDVAVIESLIQADPVFEDFSYEGVPDMRIVTFMGFPVMAMIRLPTAASDGKANLHQGAVGVGLDIGTGRAIGGVQFDRPISHHPDTNNALTDLIVPHWDRVLDLAARCCEMSGLGYIGVDIVLDRRLGPMLLELNARPGLAIQTANAEGILPRLRNIEALGKVNFTTERRIAYSKKYFSRFPESDSDVIHYPVSPDSVTSEL